jgi:hypothetical protein
MLNEIGMEPSGQVYGNMDRDDDEEVQPSKRCESTVSTVLQRTKFHRGCHLGYQSDFTLVLGLEKIRSG